jgi:dTDP-glucose pyrophosphorylase
MIIWALESISGLIDFQLIFIVLESDLNIELNDILKQKGKIITLEQITDGAVSSTLKASSLINNENPLIIVNCDQYIEWDINKFITKAKNFDGSVVVFKSNNIHHSFISKRRRKIIRVEEKIAISNLACGGIYYYRSGKDFVTMAKKYIDRGLRTNGEFYISPIFNEYIGAGKVITFFKVKKSKIHMLGTPEEVAVFKRKYNRKVRN